MARLLLASESARRFDLLRLAGYAFETRKSGFPEVTLENPKETVEANARGKALAVAETLKDDEDEAGTVVLAADTIVYAPGSARGERVLGQAGNGGDVRRMLGALRGRVHEVHSGVAVVGAGGICVRHSVTNVRMRCFGGEEIEAYARLGEGVGKAGGYAIQGRAAVFVEWIGGDYTNVVGLPLALSVRMLSDSGVHPDWLAPASG